MPERKTHSPGLDCCSYAAFEGLDNTRARAPCQVKSRHGIAVPIRRVAASLGPTDNWKDPVTHLVQPGAFLAGREMHVGLRPLARPLVFGAVEACRAEPVLPGEVGAVAYSEASLLGGVDEEQPAQRPPRLTAKRLLALLIDEDDVASIGSGLRGCHHARPPRADDRP